MPSKRRRRSKNLGTNLAEVQRRLRYLERRPVRTKLQRNVVTTASIAVNAVGPDEVSFGTTVITDAAANTIENPKDGLLVINETAGTTSVYSEEQRDYIQLPAVDDDARTVANGKNTIYYQNSQPTGGTYAVDDTWFDSDDGYKMYTWNGTAWSGFQLGNSAIAEISATKITAGSLAAGVIVTSNLSAGQITTGSLSSAIIATTALNANNITSGTITGVTFQTSTINTGRSIQITDDDNIVFRTTSDTYTTTPGIVGLITVVNQSYSDPEADENWDFQDAVFMSGRSNSLPSQGAPSYPAVFASETGSNGIAGLFGSSATYLTAQTDIIEVAGNNFSVYSDIVTFNAGYSDNAGDPWRIELNGRLVLSEDVDAGPLSLGSGQPSYTGNDLIPGQIVFRYT